MQVTLANWRTAPFNRWAFHHVRELIPTADIANDPHAIRPLSAQPAAMGLDAFLLETDTDGMAILHRGRLVFERYANGMTDETPHILMSVSKSMLGLLIRELGLEDTRLVVEKATQHGGPVHYVSPNSDLLGWVVERAAGGRYADLMSELVTAGDERAWSALPADVARIDLTMRGVSQLRKLLA
jgi:CubicO group peptidase (beta-lactamase class C family)